MSERLTPTTRALYLSAVLFITSTALSAEWESLPRLPEPNGGFICGANWDRLVVVGGTNWEGGTKNWLRTTHEYYPADRTWQTRDDLQSPVAYGVGSWSSNGTGMDGFTFIGGSDGSHALKSGGVFYGVKSILGQANDLPDAIVLSAGGDVGGMTIIVGGTDDAANIAGSQVTAHSVVRRGYNWIVGKLPDYPGRPFCAAASATIGRKLFVFGGANWDSRTGTVVNSSEAYAFSAAQSTWKKIKPLPAPVRGLSGIALDDHRIYLAGGYKTDPEGFTDKALIYEVNSDSYLPAKPLPYRAMVGMVKLDGFVYCIGGEDEKKSRTDKFFRIAASQLSN